MILRFWSLPTCPINTTFGGRLTPKLHWSFATWRNHVDLRQWFNNCAFAEAKCMSCSWCLLWSSHVNKPWCTNNKLLGSVIKTSWKMLERKGYWYNWYNEYFAHRIANFKRCHPPSGDPNEVVVEGMLPSCFVGPVTKMREPQRCKNGCGKLAKEKEWTLWQVISLCLFVYASLMHLFGLWIPYNSFLPNALGTFDFR